MSNAFIYVHRQSNEAELAINVSHIIGVERHETTGRAMLTLTGSRFETLRESFADVIYLIQETAPKPLEAELEARN